MLFGTLRASPLRNIMEGKGIVTAGSENKKEKGIVRAGYGREWHFLIPLHTLTNFKIQKYYQNEARSNGVLIRNNLPKKIKDGAYAANLDEYEDV